MQRVEQVENLTVEEVSVVRSIRTVGKAPAVKFVTDHADAGFGQAVKGRVPHVVGRGEAGNQQQRCAALRAARLIMRDALRELHELAGRFGARGIVECEVLAVGAEIAHRGEFAEGRERHQHDRGDRQLGAIHVPNMMPRPG